MYQPGMGAGGGAAGAGLGSLGRSPFLDLLKPLDYPRQALWNMVRGGGRLAGGEGSLDDLLGMVPGLAGAGMAALGPLGMLGGALAGGAVQGLGKMTGSDAFEASTPQDITGSEDFLPNLAVGAATDPLTYTGLGFGRHAAPPLPESAAAQQAGRMKMGLAPEYTGGEGGLLGPSRQPLLDPIYHAHPLEGIEPPPLSAPPTPEASPLPAAAPGPLSPDQAFEQMLPDYRRYAQVRAAAQNPRNAMPEGFGGLTPAELDATRDVPTARLPEFLNAPEGLIPPEEAVQFRRANAVRPLLSTTGRQLEQHAPLAAQLAKSGQLGPIESRLQTNWGILGDMAQDQYLTPQQLLQQARAAQLEDEAFRTLFQRYPTGSTGKEAGQEAILNQLLGDLGQAHPGLAGQKSTSVLGSLDPGSALGRSAVAPGPATFGGNPVTPQQLQQAQMARYLGLFQGDVGELPNLSVPSRAPAPPPPLPEQLLQDLRAQGTAPGMFAGNPAYPGQPYAGLGGPSPPPVTNPLANLDPSYHGALPGATNLGTHPLEDVGFTSNPFTQPGPADLHGMDLLPHEQGLPPPPPSPFMGAAMPGRAEPQAPFFPLPDPYGPAFAGPPGATPPIPLPPAPGGPIPARIPSPLREPPLDWAPHGPRGVDLEVQGQFAPGSQQGLGQFIETLQQTVGRPLTREERDWALRLPPQQMAVMLRDLSAGLT